MNIPSAIQEALSNPVDYSEEFTARIAGLSAALQDALALEVTHHADMSYRAGQDLSFVVFDTQPRGRRRPASIEVRVYVSSRSRVFAFYCFDSTLAFMPSGGLNHPVPPELLPAFAERSMASCRAVLAQRQYQEVQFQWFRVPAPGCMTEMDELPATIFDVLFAEVV